MDRYTADVGMGISACAFRATSEYSFTDPQKDGQLSWLLACG